MERIIEGTTTLHASAERAMRVLRDDDHVVLDGREFALQRHRELGLGPLHHEITIELGPPEVDLSRLSRRIGWEAAGHRDLFPVFEGEIVVERGENGAAFLRLRGLYIVPFGGIGGFGDGVAGRRLARRSIAGFVDDIARRVDLAAEPLEPHDEPYAYDVQVTDWITSDDRALHHVH